MAESDHDDSPANAICVPRSVAIIMDGNGRWARDRGMQRIKGHESGATAVRETVEECAKLGVEALTLYAFSEENWSRPKLEVKLLMALLERFLTKERDSLMRNRIKLLHAGRMQRLPQSTTRKLEESIEMTQDNDGMRLCLAVSYGGRAEIVDAARRIAEDVAAGRLQPADIDEAAVQARLYQPSLPDPDLLIRTAGEMRISNFLLWQISYAELHVAPVCWPEFRKQHLWAAFSDFGRRVRRFGAVIP